MHKIVIAGPHRIARRYAARRGWPEENFLIITRAHQLADLDPALISAIIVIGLHHLGQRIVTEISEEIRRLRALWPVPTVSVA